MTASDHRANKPIKHDEVEQESIGAPGGRVLMTRVQGTFVVLVTILILAVVAWMNRGGSPVEDNGEQPAAQVSNEKASEVLSGFAAADRKLVEDLNKQVPEVVEQAVENLRDEIEDAERSPDIKALEKRAAEVVKEIQETQARAKSRLDNLSKELSKAKPKAEPKPLIKPAPVVPAMPISPAYTRGEGLPPKDVTQFSIWLRRRQHLLTRDFEKSYQAELDSFGWLSRKSLEWSYGPNWKSKFETAVKVVGRDALWTAATPLAVGCYLDVETETDLQMADNLFNYRLLENQEDLVEAIYDAIVAHVDRMEDVPVEVKIPEKVKVPGTSEEEAPPPVANVTVA